MFNEINITNVRYVEYILDDNNKFIKDDEKSNILKLFKVFKNDIKNNNLKNILPYAIFFSILNKISEHQNEDINFISKDELINISRQDAFLKILEFSTNHHLFNSNKHNIINTYDFIKYVQYQNEKNKIIFFNVFFKNNYFLENFPINIVLFKDCIDAIYESLKLINKEFYLIDRANSLIEEFFHDIKYNIPINKTEQHPYFKELLNYVKVKNFKITFVNLLNLFERRSQFRDNPYIIDFCLKVADKESLKKEIKNKTVKIRRKMNYKELKYLNNCISDYLGVEVQVIGNDHDNININDFKTDDQILLISLSDNNEHLYEILKIVKDKKLYFEGNDSLELKNESKDFLILQFKK